MDHRYGGAAVNLPLSLVVTSGGINRDFHIRTCHDGREAGQKHPLDEVHAVHSKASMTIGEPFTDKDMQKVFQRHESNSKTL